MKTLRKDVTLRRILFRSRNGYALIETEILGPDFLDFNSNLCCAMVKARLL
jgi:hypothetical protein